MKDNLFEMLLNLFETSLTELQKDYKSDEQKAAEVVHEEDKAKEGQVVYIKQQEHKSTRVFTRDEQMKLTEASSQFLMRMKLWDVINAESFELIINQLQASDSHIITLEETKWTIREVLSSTWSEEHLSFLDLILYQVEDKSIAH